MIIRTSTFGQNKSQLSQLMAQQNKLLELQMQADSKKKVNGLSDNPTETSTIMNLNNQLAQIKSYYANIDSAQNQLSNLDDIYNGVNKKLDRLHDLGLQLLNGSGSPETINATQDEINQIIESVVDSANSNYNGEFVFSGAKVDSPPYAIERGPDGNITGITYSGSAQGAEGAERKLEISTGVKVGVNSTGDSVFGSYQAGPPEVATGLFGALGQISNTRYPNTDGMTDADAQAAVATYFGDLETAMAGAESGQKHVAAVRSDFGARSSRITLTKSSLEDLELSTTSHKSSIVDLDMVEALSNLVQQNYAYQASMSTYNMLQQNSLLNYLK